MNNNFLNANLKEVDYLNSVYELLFASFPHRSFILKKYIYTTLYYIYTLYALYYNYYMHNIPLTLKTFMRELFSKIQFCFRLLKIAQKV